jgi:hypothetical protein
LRQRRTILRKSSKEIVTTAEARTQGYRLLVEEGKAIDCWQKKGQPYIADRRRESSILLAEEGNP